MNKIKAKTDIHNDFLCLLCKVHEYITSHLIHRNQKNKFLAFLDQMSIDMLSFCICRLLALYVSIIVSEIEQIEPNLAEMILSRS